MNYSIFAERLSELLFESQLNPPAFAAKIGCGRNTINRYLSGNNMPALNLVIRMATISHVLLIFLWVPHRKTKMQASKIVLIFLSS